MAGCEQGSHHPSIRSSEDGGAFQADVIHDGPDVVHPLFERRKTPRRRRVGQPYAVLVEGDDAAEGAEAVQEVSEARKLPSRLQVAEPDGDQHQVQRAATADLIGDVDVAAGGVTGRRKHPGDPTRGHVGGELLMAEMAAEVPLFLEFSEAITHDTEDVTLGWCDDKTEFEFALDLILDGLDRLRG